MSTKTYRPDWAPQEEDARFACRVMSGVDGGHDGMPEQAATAVPAAVTAKRKRKLDVADYVAGVLQGDRTVLSRAITLIESNAPSHFAQAQEGLQELLPATGRSLRLGITGVPGAGKSTFIEALGSRLCEGGHKVAVLAVDPSSTLTKGSILGDKTRMEQLSRQPNAFIRPSPSCGTLGGVARKSRETMLLCEAAGFDVILVETVGVGQSEVTVRSMVDFFLLVVLTGAGDELQGMKKGVMELADAILVHKADGDNRGRAGVAKGDYDRMLHYLRPATEGWETKAYTASSRTGAGIGDIWSVVLDFQEKTSKSGVFSKRRQEQALSWMYALVEEHLRELFFQHPKVKEQRGPMEQLVRQGTLSPTLAARRLIERYETAGNDS